MKSMKCNQLGGACNQVFEAETFQEIAELSKQHAMTMYEAADEAHISKMKEMQELMKSPTEMQAWFERKRKEFEAMPDL